MSKDSPPSHHHMRVHGPCMTGGEDQGHIGDERIGEGKGEGLDLPAEEKCTPQHVVCDDVGSHSTPADPLCIGVGENEGCRLRTRSCMKV